MLRARVFLRAVLPLVEVIAAERPALGRLPFGGGASVWIGADDPLDGATLRFADGRVTVGNGPLAGPDAQLRFRDRRALADFFAGRPSSAPRVVGWRHPLALAATVRLVAALRLLEPGPPPAAPAARALRVRLLLYLATRALAELYRGGHRELVELVDGGGERVYQFTVGDSPIAAYLRAAPGRVKAGRGVYAGRRPFVHFAFRDVDAALAVLGSSESQMAGVRSGALLTLGSPEYVRAIARQLQRLDALLREG